MRETFKFVCVVILSVAMAVSIAYFQNKKLEQTYENTDWIFVPIDSE